MRRTTHVMGVLGLLFASTAWAQEIPASEQAARGFDPAQVEVVVVGAPHLQGMKPEDKPALDLIRGELARFEPDQVVVEWLHPSIDPATTSNYRPLEDLPTLAWLWGYELADVDSASARTRELLTLLKQRGSPAMSARVELGKLYYLSRDRLNAGYQWWIADRLGADVGDLKRLTRANFEGHELEKWGFPIAYGQGLEYITPFDYQGEDAAWIWMDIVEAVAVHALATAHGLREGDAGWDAALEGYLQGVAAWVNEGAPAWIEQYGDIKEVAEFGEVVKIWTERRGTTRSDSGPPGLSEMRYNQSAEHAVDNRYMYDVVFPKLSLAGLGQKLVDNWILRNRRMVDFVEQDAKAAGSRRILIIVGEGHRPFLVEELERRGYRVRPSSEFIP